MWMKEVFIVFIAVIGHVTNGQTPCGDTHFGENNPDSKDDDIDSNNDFGYMMGATDYIVDCCGIVDRWQAEFDAVSGSRTIYFQVWRPTTGTAYELVGQNSMTVNSDGEQETNVPQNERITVKDRDRWGWWSDGTDIITYKGGKKEEDNNMMMTLTAKSVGDTQDWGSATTENDRSYAMRMDVLSNNDPQFTNLPDTVSIPATTSSGTSIFDVSVDDIDTYDVSSLSVSMTVNSDYSFDTGTYIISTDTTFSSSTVDNLKFTVTDQCGKSATATLTVSVTNEPPVINTLPSSESISEDETVEKLLHTIGTTDPEGSTVTCSLASTVPSSSSFTVRSTGTDNGIYSNTNPGFDYSTTSSYTLNIDCTDGEHTVSDTFTAIILQNTPPVFLNLQNSTSVSTTTTIGTTAFTVLVDDTDDLTYTMSCAPTPCPFQIFHSGQIQISEDLSDHTTVGYDLNITVSDSRNTVGPRILTITLADINDPVTISNLPVTQSVVENTNIGATIYTVSYSDVDSSQSHTISMTSSPATGLTYFSIDSSSGEVTTIGAIDYETIGTTTFTFDVTVSDPITSDTKILTIEVINENEAPSFSQTSYSISTTEGSAGTVIGTPVFGNTDEDSGDTSVLTNDCGAQTGYFLMNTATGEVSFQSDYDLDTGSLPTTVSCTVTVTDSGGLTDTATLIINIAFTNDNTPVFSPTTYNFYVSYYASAGTSVGTITATDSDASSHGTITYTLDQSSLTVEHFAISNTGEITVKTTPEGSVMGYSASVTLTATASDIDGQSDTATVVIIVSDTTTTSTTTTTDRYRTFLEDTKNIAWLSACIVVLLVTLCFLIYVIYTCHGEKGCARFSRTLCNRKKKPSRHRRRRSRNGSFDNFSETDNRRGRPARMSDLGPSVRQPPPPAELRKHHWI